ncbi:hypothetical protein N7516_001022 [Penicillium verrucosum]|uniref:uncharacterized protein n=1 Tax=Penicillium verrucosum TaxID=60171 RepID=UPI002545B510|nr:uncharacterized protein N7516_001022 [Penicillium verrucosum]KAJ5940854.1 hypothetical protein N7516_001022 [Penicillium verrucosum]
MRGATGQLNFGHRGQLNCRHGDDCLEYDTIPVMAITIFARMKARIIEAYSSQQGLVMRKTEFFDFSTKSQTRI